jgi:excisionase family DNA binding protein
MKKAPPSRLPGGLESEVMTVGDIAQYLHCHISTIYRLLGQTQIPAFQLGGDWRFFRSDVDNWIAAGGAKPSGRAPAKSGDGRRGRKPLPMRMKS